MARTYARIVNPNRLTYMSHPEESPQLRDESYYRNMAILARRAALMEQEDYDPEGAAAIYSRIGVLAMDEANVPAYAHFPMPQRQREELAANIELLRDYDAYFAEPVARLREALSGPNPPEPIAVTPMARVYRMTVRGAQYVVRFADPQLKPPYVDEEEVWSPQGITNRYAHDLFKGRDIARNDIERIVGVNYEAAAVVSRAQPGGGTGRKFDMERMRRVTDLQMRTLLDAVEALYNAGPDYDANHGNLLYDPEAGFSIVDFVYNDRHNESFEETIADVIGSCVETSHDQQVPDDEIAMRFALFDRFAAICQERYAHRPFWPRMQEGLRRIREQDILPAPPTPWDEVLPAEGETSAASAEGVSIEAVNIQVANIEQQLVQAEQGLVVDLDRLRGALELMRATLEGSTNPSAIQAQQQLALAGEKLESVIRHLQRAAGKANEFRNDL